ncbi:MAG: glycosyltransferase [Candidatus Competibacteraceae bacterium]|jgi:glycosyltransferase involved in cell wall biosynthesis|nr:glycosyltransferase [Candidatus Competibacteraceae bacterium]
MRFNRAVDAQHRRIALLLQHGGDGGVERCFINLARGFVERGIATDLLIAERNTPFLGHLDPQVRLIHMPVAGSSSPRALANYIDQQQPQILLAAKDEDCKLAITARTLSPRPRICLCASVNYSAQLAGHGKGPLRRWLRYKRLRQMFNQADTLICVSAGVAADLAMILGKRQQDLHVLPNPVVTPELTKLAKEPVHHPWFAEPHPPVILGVGRLGRIKNFSLLLRAFAVVHQQCEARLIILGEGRQRAQLTSLATQLGMAEAVDLPGFVENPLAFMARAAVFVLSSRWEGFGNVLVEALACGTPAVATDCPSGPAEILQAGKIGSLVPVDDPAALSKAILSCLANPPQPETLRQAALRYSLENSCEAYLRVFESG